MSTDELRAELLTGLENMILHRMTASERRDFRQRGERLLETLVALRHAQAARKAITKERESLFQQPAFIEYHLNL